MNWRSVCMLCVVSILLSVYIRIPVHLSISISICLSLYLSVCRIPWKVPSEAYTTSKTRAYGAGTRTGAEEEETSGTVPGLGLVLGSGLPMEEVQGGGDGTGDETKTEAEDVPPPSASGPGITEPLIAAGLNECNLLWQGVLPKRIFHGFKFQVRQTRHTDRTDCTHLYPRYTVYITIYLSTLSIYYLTNYSLHIVHCTL